VWDSVKIGQNAGKYPYFADFGHFWLKMAIFAKTGVLGSQRGLFYINPSRRGPAVPRDGGARGGP